MNEDTHVYCTNCVNGDNLLRFLLGIKEMPYNCDYCHPENPEDSFPLKIRQKYERDELGLKY